jgi:pimeloyl-ACP methyl ester carboxylesterase
MFRLRTATAVLMLCGLLAASSCARAANAPESRSFDARGVKIHYLIAGHGPAVVLIHGLHSSAEINWRMNGVIAELAKDHTVIAFDMPGHGRSDKPDGDEAYGRQLVEDVVLLLDELKIRQAQMVGYSLGGMVIMRLLADHPERVSAALLGGMGWLRDGSPQQRFWEHLPAREGTGTPPAFVRNVAQLALTEEEVRKIRVPVEIVLGTRDPVKRSYVEPLERVQPQWPVVEIDGAGHISCILKSQFRDAIATWVRKQTADR